MTLPELLTVKEVSEYLKVSERTVTDWAQKGDIPCGKIGNSWRFSMKEVSDWLTDKFYRTNKPAKKEITIKNILLPENIIIIDTDSKETALNNIIDCLHESGHISNRQEFAEAIFKREALMSTGIGLGIAIPHVRLSSIQKLAMAIGVSKKDITDYDSLDNIPVKLIFMISANTSQHSDYLKLLSDISMRMKNKLFREAIQNAESATEVYNLLAREG